MVTHPDGNPISVATRFDMATAATLRGCVTPIMPFELKQTETDSHTLKLDLQANTIKMPTAEIYIS